MSTGIAVRCDCDMAKRRRNVLASVCIQKCYSTTFDVSGRSVIEDGSEDAARGTNSNPPSQAQWSTDQPSQTKPDPHRTKQDQQEENKRK